MASIREKKQNNKVASYIGIEPQRIEAAIEGHAQLL